MAKAYQAHHQNNAGVIEAWTGWCTGWLRFLATMIKCGWRYEHRPPEATDSLT
jgi:hypothetical protein